VLTDNTKLVNVRRKISAIRDLIKEMRDTADCYTAENVGARVPDMLERTAKIDKLLEDINVLMR
jgi:hypothetical protein